MVCMMAAGHGIKKILAITLENMVKIRLFSLFTAKFKVTQKFHYTSAIKNKTGKYLTTSFYFWKYYLRSDSILKSKNLN